MVACTLERNWLTYIVASLISLFGGVIILFLVRTIYNCVHGITSKDGRRVGRVKVMLSRMQAIAEAILYGNTPGSKAIVFTFWFLDMASTVVYIYQATLSDPANREDCGKTNTPAQIIWIALMGFSLMRFITRFFAYEDKVRMWIDIDSIVDHFTIVPTLIGIYYDNNWLGLRFFRVLHLLRLSDMLRLTNIITNQRWIQLVTASTLLLSAWSFGAGMFFLVENAGDPWNNFENQNPQNMTFWDSHYLVLIIISTIGFGDFYPQTDIGKIFLAIYVLMCLATVGQVLPEVSQVFGDRSKFKVPYSVKASRRHIVITGNITYATLTSVVKMFIQQSKETPDIVLIDRERPTSKIQAFFRCHYNNVTFIEGTVMRLPTLKRAKVDTASAVLILANRLVDNQDDEDTANIMRATAVKNFRSDVRIVVQLLQHRNQEQLTHIPGWSWRRGEKDEIICISELKMGIMAKNCSAPGCSTLLSNLITNVPLKKVKRKKLEPWKNDYLSGAEQNVFIEKLSNGFSGMRFSEAAELCFRRFGVVLLAILDFDQNVGVASRLRVNPANFYIIREQQLGFFIARDRQDAQRVAHYCTVFDDPGSKPNKEDFTMVPVVAYSNEITISDEYLLEMTGENHNRHQQRTSVLSVTPATLKSKQLGGITDTPVQEIFDPSGTFYWCPSVGLQDALLDSDSVREHNLRDHVIFILDTSLEHTLRGCELQDFLIPLRDSCIPADELKPVVFYVSQQLICSEWDSIACYPQVFVFLRSGVLHQDLKALNIQRCTMCLIMDTTGLKSIDDTFIDTNALQTSMQIKSIYKRRSNLSNQPSGFFRSNSSEDVHTHSISDTDVQMLLVLEHEATVTFVDDDDEDDPSLPISLSAPFACGRVLLTNVLDALVTTAYLNSDLIRLFRTLISCVEITDFEALVAEGLGIVRRRAVIGGANARQRSCLTLLDLSQSPLKNVTHGNEYGQLVVGCIRSHGILCLGLYRLMYTSDTQQHTPNHSIRPPSCQKRFVITNPPYDFQLQPSDKVYTLKPFSDTGYDHSPTSMHINTCTKD